MFVLYLFASAYSDVKGFACGANIDGNFYNLESAISTEYFTVTDGSYTYKIKLCGALPTSAFPSGFNPVYDASAIRCVNNTNNCQVIAYYSTQQYKYLGSRPNDGILMLLHAENMETFRDFEFFNLLLAVAPDDSTDTWTYKDFHVNPIYDDILNIEVSFANKFAKPSPTTAPTPFPGFEGDCQFDQKSNVIYPYEVDISLSKYNSQYVVPVNNSCLSLVNPCGVMDCPVGKVCDTELSSIWICQNDNCKSYGNAKEKLDIKLRHDFVDEGLNVTLGHASIAVTCDFEVHHKLFRLEKTIFDKNNNVYVSASSSDVCMKPPESTPDPSRCKRTFKAGNERIQFDLTRMNTLGGYGFDVNWNISTPGVDYSAHVQPCGGLNCPGGSCTEPNGATVWVCDRIGDQPWGCDPYGVFYDTISVEESEKGIDDGVKVLYSSTTGPKQLKSIVYYRCDWLLSEAQARFNSDAEMSSDKGTAILHARTKQVCYGQEPWFPPTPKPTVMPDPDPNPPRVYVNKVGDKTVSFDISQMFDGAPNQYNVKLNENTNMTLWYSPFAPTACPRGFDCESRETADGWGCWYHHCFPIALHDYNVEGVPSTDINTATFIVKGQSDYRMKFVVACDMNHQQIQVSDAVTATDDNLFTVRASARFACYGNGPLNPSFSGGAVFLLIVILCVVLYLGLGTFVLWVWTGRVNMPNASFWSEVGESVKYVFTSCGQKNQGYDNI